LDSQRSLIVTIRRRTLNKNLINGKPCIKIPPFIFQEARILLRLKIVKITDNQNESDMKKLLKILDHISLTITQAAAFIRQYSTSLQKYLKNLEKKEQNIKNHLNTEF
jgi:hypothetical protein